MELFQWDASYSVQVANLDKQHQVIFQLINELQDALKSGHGKDHVGAILDRLVAYTKSHFAEEEALLKANKYPDYEAHIAKHKLLLDRVSKLQEDYKAGNAGLAVELMELLQTWLRKHIQSTDKKYAPFLNEKGVH